MTELEELKLQAYEVANQLRGLPTRETLKDAYLQYDFNRKRVAEHFNITTARLNDIKRKLLGDAILPSGATYVRQWNEVKWYTAAYPEWTHVSKNIKTNGEAFYKSH